MKTLVALLLIFLSASHAFAQNPVWSKKYHKNTLTTLTISNDGSKLLTGAYEDGIILWSIPLGDSIRKYRNVKATIKTLDFTSKDSSFIATNPAYSEFYDLEVIRRNVYNDSAEVLLTMYNLGGLEPPEYKGNGLGYAIDGSTINTICYLLNDSMVITGVNAMLLDVHMGGPAKPFGPAYNITLHNLNTKKRDTLLRKEMGYFKDVVHSLSKNIYFVAFNSSGVIYNKKEKTISQPTLRSSQRAAVSANDSILMIAYYNNSVDIFKVSGEFIQLMTVPTQGITALGVDVKNRYYISTHTDSTIRLWTPGIPNIFKSFKTDDYVIGIAMSPDSTHFATIHKEGTVALWNIDSLALKAVTDSVFTPVIDSVSPNKVLCTDADAELTVSARSNFGEGLSYQWQKGGVNLSESDSVSGVASATLLLKNIDKSDAGSYSVVVSSLKNSSITSPPAMLSVRGVPVITVQPITKTELYNGEKIVLKITLADTTGAQYQWFKNGEPIAGAVSAAYTVTADSGSVAGGYTVRITNQCGSVESDEAEIVVLTTDITEENPFKTTTLSTEPNPFKNSTTIRFSLEKPLKIKLAVTDALGREVAVLKDGFLESGEQEIIFKNDALPQGNYYITLSGEGLLQTIPVKILR